MKLGLHIPGPKNAGNGGGGNSFSGDYHDLENKPQLPTLSLVPVYSGGLNSSNQDTNDEAQVYAWDAAGLVADQGMTLEGNTQFTATEGAVFQVSAAIEVSDSTANERAVYVLEIQHLGTDGSLVETYTQGGAYIRDDTTFSADKASAGGSVNIELAVGESVQVRTRRLYSQDRGDDNPADPNLSRCVITRWASTLTLSNDG